MYRCVSSMLQATCHFTASIKAEVLEDTSNPRDGRERGEAMEKLAMVVTARGAQKRWREQIPIQGKVRGHFQNKQVVTMPDARKRCGKRERGLRCSQ